MSDEAPEKEADESADPAAPSPPRRSQPGAPRPDEEPPRRKKKRRKQPAAEAAEAPARDEDAGEEAEDETKASAQKKAPPRDDKPSFAHDFPSDPALDALVAAFEAGDYARVRREAPALARSTDRDDVRAAARELRRRLDPDPMAAYLLGIAAVLLVFLAGWYWLHPHTP